VPCHDKGRIFLAIPTERSQLGWKLLRRDRKNFPVGMDIPNYYMEGLENSLAGMDITNYCMAGLKNSPAGKDIPNY
jgi:hypothetical protein